MKRIVVSGVMVGLWISTAFAEVKTATTTRPATQAAEDSQVVAYVGDRAITQGEIDKVVPRPPGAPAIPQDQLQQQRQQHAENYKYDSYLRWMGGRQSPVLLVNQQQHQPARQRHPGLRGKQVGRGVTGQRLAGQVGKQQRHGHEADHRQAAPPQGGGVDGQAFGHGRILPREQTHSPAALCIDGKH